MTISIPNLSVTVFRQTSAPTKWVKVTTYTDYAIRVTSGSGGGTGGSTTFSTIYPASAKPVTATVDGVTGVTHGPFTITGPTMGAHAHTITPYFTYSGPYGIGPSFPGPGPVIGQTPVPASIPTYFQTPASTSSVGGNNTHGHPGGAGAPSPAAGSFSFAIKYLDVILCSRNGN